MPTYPRPEPRRVPTVAPLDIYDCVRCHCGHVDGDDLATCIDRCEFCHDAQREALVIALNAIDRFLWVHAHKRYSDPEYGEAIADLRDAGNHIDVHPI